MADQTSSSVALQESPNSWRSRLRRLGDWVLEYGLLALGFVVSLALLAVLAVWLGVSYFWAAEESAPLFTYSAGELGGAPVVASVAYPRVALQGRSGHRLTFDFKPDGAGDLPSLPAIVIITLSEGLTFGPAGGPAARILVVPLRSDNPDDRRVAVINDGSYAKGRQPAMIMVWVCDPAAAGHCLPPLVLQPRVEGRGGFRLRRFANGAVNQASPLILLLAVVAPWVATVGQKELNRHSALLRKQRQLEFEGHTRAFRDTLCALDGAGARKRFEDMRASPHAHRGGDDLEMAEHLAALADLSYEPPTAPDAPLLLDSRVREMGRRWPREFVAAACLAEEARPAKEATLSASRKSVGTLHAWLDGVWEEARNISLEEGDYLLLRRAALEVRRLASQTREFEPSASFYVPPYVITDNRLARPFAGRETDARAEQEFLWRGGAFWGGHPLLRGELSQSKHSHIIRGAAGSGRSALATMLPLGVAHDPSILFVRPEGDLSPAGISRAVARQLLHVVLEAPPRLARYGEGQRTLSRFVGGVLGPETVRAQLDKRQLQIAQIALEKSSRDAIGVRVALEQLESFKRMLPAEPAPPPEGRAWRERVLEVIPSLGLTVVVLVIELAVDQLDALAGAADWAGSYREGVHLCLFVDEDFPRDRIPDAPNMARDGRLTWNESQLRDMLAWRFEHYLEAGELAAGQRRHALHRSFADGAAGLKRLIEACRVAGEYNPGRFMALWRAAVGDKRHGDLITAEELDAAIPSTGAAL